MTVNKPLLVLQLRPEERIADSEYACFLKYGQLSAAMTERFRIEEQGIPADLRLDDYSAILVGGSPFDISTSPKKKSAEQLTVEADFRRLLQQVIALDFPFLGACSGNGLLGHYLGAGISTRYGEAVGCVELDITEQGKRDKLLKGFPEQIDVLLGHKEACDETPTGATLLMTGRDCPVQMFRVGENIYATQFHPEGDAEEFALRIDAYKHHGYFLPDEAEQLVQAVSRRPTPYAQEILRRFVATYVLGVDA
ncbi:glutamine amidotransferase [Porticoccus sp.]